MEKRELELVAAAGSGIDAANFDFDEERTEGKAGVATPQQLISVLAAILRTDPHSKEGIWMEIS